jgi:hypothetical protein
VLYLAAAALALFAAAAELIGRFRDEPFQVFLKPAGLAYLLLNGILAAVVLWGLRYAGRPETDVLALEQVLLAGFGARILLRTKLVGIRGRAGTEQDVGPGAFFDKLLSTLSRAADRDLASKRLAETSDLLKGVRWEKAGAFFEAEMAGAMQDLTADEKREIRTAIEVIQGRDDLDNATRVDLLGYLVLEYGGREFLEALVKLYWDRFPPEEAAPAEPTLPAT